LTYDGQSSIVTNIEFDRDGEFFAISLWAFLYYVMDCFCYILVVNLLAMKLPARELLADQVRNVDLLSRHRRNHLKREAQQICKDLSRYLSFASPETLKQKFLLDSSKINKY
jgi:hypothetical protein